MSCYILHAGQSESKFKAVILCKEYGATRIPEPAQWPAPDGQVYVCVVENAWFDAALVCLTEEDYQKAKYDGTGRSRTWVQMDRGTVRDLVEWRYKAEPALQ